MHRTKYGILLQDITDLQLTILLDTGSTAAKQVIQKRYFGKPAKRLKLNKRIEELYRIGITFNSMYDELPYPSIVSILTVPKKRIERLPLRALINPTNNPTLNNKLSQVYWDETLEQNEKNIRFSNLIFDDQDLIFTASDIKKIRFSIIWLNHIMSMKLKTKLYQKCLSNDAFKIFISEGFRGLYRISKKNKRKLNRFFKAADEVENMDFLRLSSIGLNNLWNYTFTKKDQQKIIKSYNLIRLEKHKPYSFSSIPSFYIYNSVYNLDIKKLELLYRRGYTNMKSLRIFNPNNQKFLSDPELYEILYENYGNYKN